MYSVILCGGSGTRLWPLSRKNFPKQFLNLYNENSLLQETFLRMRKIMPAENIFLVTNKDNYFNVLNQIKDISDDFPEDRILTEPASLNTAPAIAFAVKFLSEKQRIDLASPVIFLPSDHYISDENSYLSLVKESMDRVGDNVGTIGITPDKPETGFGYIKKGEKENKYFKVLEFKEKPSKERAEEYLNSGEYVWNSGMYIFSPRTFIKELRRYCPEIYNLLTKDYNFFLEKFHTLPEVSIDVAVSEKSDKVIVFEGDFGWSDIGSFDSLAEISEKNGIADKKKDRHISIDSRNIFIHSVNDRLIATLGVEDLIIIENNDSILIQKKGKSNDVKKIVEFLKDKKYKELDHNVIVYKPWGKYEVLIDNPTCKVKKITVYPGAKLSLQSHFHRAEHWIVVKGMAKVVNGERNIFLNENESTFIPANTVHRVENPGKIGLEIIEAQTGNYLEEDDIIRYNDDYDRI